MKENKPFIGVLVLIGVLFVLGLGSGMFRDKEENDGELNMRKVEELKNRWIGSLNNMMASFRKPLDLDRIEIRPYCQINDGIFRLTDNQPCSIVIASKGGADLEKAVLSVQEKNVKIRVPYPNDESSPEITGNSRISPAKLKPSKVITDIERIKPGMGHPGVFQQPPELSVVYTPFGVEEKKGKWEVIKDVDLIILKEGGTLKLQCKGCSDTQTVTAVLE
jgi:hypothetical protein